MRGLSKFRFEMPLFLLSPAISLAVSLGLMIYPGRAYSDAGYGRAVIVKGVAFQKKPGGQETALSVGDPIAQNSIIRTGSQSAVKIALIDNSTLTLGSESTARMDDLKNTGLRSVSLLGGQLRSHVIRDLYKESNLNLASKGSGASADLSSQPKIKFIFRTKTAVMGVRGTELEIIYNPQNQVTSLVTLEGAVAMMKADPQGKGPIQSEILAPLLSSEKSRLVTQGQFSTAHPALASATVPIKISPLQFESLKKADPVIATPKSSSETSPSKPNISPIPPGMDPKHFAATGPALPAENAVPANQPPPEGSFNNRTGGYAPPAGGFVDLKSGLYIPPPPGSVFDSNQGVFIPPPSSGKIDIQSGDYMPPQGVRLDAVKGFIPANSPTHETSPSSSTDRNPSSVISAPVLLPGGTIALPKTGTITIGTTNTVNAVPVEPKTNSIVNSLPPSMPAQPLLNVPPPITFVPPPIGAPTYFGKSPASDPSRTSTSVKIDIRVK